MYIYFVCAMTWDFFAIEIIFPFFSNIIRGEFFMRKSIKSLYRHLIFAAILLIVTIFFLWNNMKLYEDWMDEATNVYVTWFDYQGVKHSRQLSNTNIGIINAYLESIDNPQKIFWRDKPRAGSSNYMIYYYGKKDIQYTIKSSGIIVVQNMNFPYQFSMWEIDKEITDEIIEYIKNFT